MNMFQTDVKALQGERTRIIEMHTLCHIVNTQDAEISFQICDTRNQTFDGTNVGRWLGRRVLECEDETV
jgi:hypothetical protein